MFLSYGLVVEGLLAREINVFEMLRAFDGHPIMASDAVGAEATRP
jgi:hypothetical protein